MQCNTVKVFDIIHFEYSTVVDISDEKTNGYRLCLSEAEKFNIIYKMIAHKV
jgi:hypothetical protein